MSFEDIFNQAKEDAIADQKDLEDAYEEIYNLVMKYFPECEDSTSLGGDDLTPILFVKRPLTDGIGWLQIAKDFHLKRILVTNSALSLDDVHYNSVVAHEVAHVAAYNYLLSQYNGKLDTDIMEKEWKSCGGHTKKWHEIADKLNSLKRKSTGKNAFDIVEKIDSTNIDRYFN